MRVKESRLHWRERETGEANGEEGKFRLAMRVVEEDVSGGGQGSILVSSLPALYP